MSLKLLKPSEARKATEVREQEDLRRADSIHAVTKELLDARVKAERDFTATLDSQRTQFELEEETRRVKRDALAKEVQDLEDRKTRALIPIIERENAIHTAEEALRVREQTLIEAESSLEDEGRALMLRLDELSEAETKAKTLSQALVSREKGTRAQEESVKVSAKQLSSALRDFEVMRLAEKERLAKWESVLDGRELALKERNKSVDAREKELANREIRLQDRTDTLERAFTRLGIPNGKRAP